MKPLTYLAVLLFFALAFSFSSAAGAESDPLTRERNEQTGTAITILFDNSGSMNAENKIGQAKAAFRTWLQTVPAEDKFSLITFEQEGRLVVPLGENTRDLVAARVAPLVANTSTPICGALRIAREQIEKRRREVTPYERHVVLIFTDGEETVDRRGIEGVREDIAALRRMSVEVVGIGFHGQGDYMDGVATRFALAGDEQELRRGLAKVDAEIGTTDDVVVSAADIAALKNFSPLPIQPASTASGPVLPAGVLPPAAEPPRHTPLRWIIPVFLVWVVIRLLTRSKKQDR